MSDCERWNTLVGCVLESKIEISHKHELIDFVRMWEERSTLWND